eukprot:MONOS_9625.1-p1 / transcript=MONOS_9625.1 / gene=MONOS_9625 / organism=Monocercomonoides_exilis_PA203 / gene_product=unspecified product / transcript_product=unspecified product / location=Mono_scaffold00403:42130-42984(-) / protein_length=230 / sequence_SO=supercontig / SO=protein_coding / is_pseudo=false
MIIEKEKKEKNNVVLLTGLCECILLLYDEFSSELLPICVPYLLKAALNKEENEEAQKEAELSFLALSNICASRIMKKELYSNEITEIIEYHQEHYNLTRLAYQSAWLFLICRLFYDRSLEDVILNKLQFERETIRELEELSKCIDWKREKDVRGKEKKEEIALLRWLQALEFYLTWCKSWSEEFVELVGSIVKIYLAAKGNHKEIGEKCIDLFVNSTYIRAIENVRKIK